MLSNLQLLRYFYIDGITFFAVENIFCELRFCYTFEYLEVFFWQLRVYNILIKRVYYMIKRSNRITSISVCLIWIESKDDVSNTHATHFVCGNTSSSSFSYHNY